MPQSTINNYWSSHENDHNINTYKNNDNCIFRCPSCNHKIESNMKIMKDYIRRQNKINKVQCNYCREDTAAIVCGQSNCIRCYERSFQKFIDDNNSQLRIIWHEQNDKIPLEVCKKSNGYYRFHCNKCGSDETMQKIKAIVDRNKQCGKCPR